MLQVGRKKGVQCSGKRDSSSANDCMPNNGFWSWPPQNDIRLSNCHSEGVTLSALMAVKKILPVMLIETTATEESLIVSWIEKEDSSLRSE